MSEAIFTEGARVRFGVWVFLASEVMFFGPVFLSYGIASYALTTGFSEAGRTTNLYIGTGNTMVLLTSSAAVAMAVAFARADQASRVRRALDVAIALGLVFLLLKGWEYRIDWTENLVPGTGFHLKDAADQRAAELFYCIYFFATLLHSVHLIIGLGLLTVCRLQFVGPKRNPRQLEGYALYWHFVDAVWIVLYPLLYLSGRSL